MDRLVFPQVCRAQGMIAIRMNQYYVESTRLPGDPYLPMNSGFFLRSPWPWHEIRVRDRIEDAIARHDDISWSMDQSESGECRMRALTVGRRSCCCDWSGHCRSTNHEGAGAAWLRECRSCGEPPFSPPTTPSLPTGTSNVSTYRKLYSI